MSQDDKSSTNSTTRHLCHCGKSFARKEHLNRHQATHDQSAYVCDNCKRRFSRRELLRRHSALHDPERTRTAISCDACRSNKTKCSGGAKCSLCTRRGINCTFRSGLQPSGKISVDDGLGITMSAFIGTINDAPQISNLAPDLPVKVLLGEDSLPKRAKELAHEWLHNCLIVPAKQNSIDQPSPVGTGMEAVYNLLHDDRPTFEGALRGRDDLRKWLANCLETYLQNFHFRWPLVHSSEFDMETARLTLVASICVIAAWLHPETKQIEREYALKVHDLLLHRSLYTLIDHVAISEGEAWPIEFFQGLLLTLIFTLYHTDRISLRRAMSLRGAFIGLLRGLGMFDTTVLAAHLQTHFNGTFAPYVFCMREKFKRLLVLTYQFDVYFALAHNQPPILHQQELGFDLTATFTLWNAHGLGVFAKRWLDEPAGRSGLEISMMMSCPSSLSPSQVLIEDAILGLCGVLQRIWVDEQYTMPNATTDRVNISQRTSSVEMLNTWKYELDKIQTNLSDARSKLSDTAKKLLQAYRIESDSAMNILERTTALTQDGFILFYHLQMCYHAGIVSSNSIDLKAQPEKPRDEILCIIKSRKIALICALQILGIAESVKASSFSVSPLIGHALAMGNRLMRSVLPFCGECECSAETDQYVDENGNQEGKDGGEPFRLKEKSLCVCKLDFWSDRFERAIKDHTVSMLPADDIVGS